MELPVETILEARGEEMKYMSEKTFKVVRMSEAYRVTGKGLLSTKWVELIRYVTLFIDMKKAQSVPKCTTSTWSCLLRPWWRMRVAS